LTGNENLFGLNDTHLSGKENDVFAILITNHLALDKSGGFSPFVYDSTAHKFLVQAYSEKGKPFKKKIFISPG
jgi:hypothetical protein